MLIAIILAPLGLLLGILGIRRLLASAAVEGTILILSAVVLFGAALASWATYVSTGG